MGQLAMILPILPGKKEKWLGMLNSMLAPGSDSRKEFNGKREAVGLHERTYLQETPNGDFMILTLEGENPCHAHPWQILQNPLVILRLFYPTVLLDFHPLKSKS